MFFRSPQSGAIMVALLVVLNEGPFQSDLKHPLIVSGLCAVQSLSAARTRWRWMRMS